MHVRSLRSNSTLVEVNECRLLSMSVSRPTSGRSGRRRGPTQTPRGDRRRGARRSSPSSATTARRSAASRRRAGVDPALVVHFFGSKESLFREVMALPPAVADAIAAPRRRPARDSRPAPRRARRRRAREPGHAADRARRGSARRARTRTPPTLVRETVTRDLGRLTAAITDDQPDTRAVLVGAHVVGIALARYVVLVEPLARCPDDVVDLLAPTFQRYLVEPLT